jgi:peptidoglycan/xylan/chitin deacetylase (PgdA/CDA1 family)
MDVPLRRDPHRLFVRPDDVRRHIEVLRDWGYELLTFSSWASRVLSGRGEGAAALTFDDGLVDNLETLAPLLEEEAAPATVFIVSQLLGKPYPAASWTRTVTAEETRELHARGVEIGGHTRTHPDLTMLSVDDAYEELAGCKHDLEELLGASVTVAAYPFGRANPDVVSVCRRAGFFAACRSSGRGEWDNPQNLPREDVANRMTLLELKLARDGRYQRLVGRRSVRALRRLNLAVRGASLRKPREIRTRGVDWYRLTLGRGSSATANTHSAMRALCVVLTLAMVPVACAHRHDAPAHGQRSDLTMPAFRGVQLHSLWSNYSYSTMYRDLSYARVAGATTVRVDVGWSSLQTEGRGNFSSWYRQKLDAFMRGAGARGLKVIATLWSTPCWASRAPASLKEGCTGAWWDRGVTAYPPWRTADYARIARWLTTRYGRYLAALEIWNEPDGAAGEFWRSPDPAGDYARLLRAAYPAAKRGDPKVVVLAGALVVSNRVFLGQLYRDGIDNEYDGLSLHPYVQGSPYAGGSASFGHQLRSIHQLQSARGDQAPIWVTEFGWSTARGEVTPRLQAEYIRDAFSILRKMRFVRAAIVYNLRDTGSDPYSHESNFGLMTSTFAPKQAFQAFADAMGRGAPNTVASIESGLR